MTNNHPRDCEWDGRNAERGRKTKKNNFLAVIGKVLPQKVTYNASNNVYLTNGWTSAAGNFYYQGIRLSERIIIRCDIGQGYAYTFLNGVNVYAYDGHNTKLIGTRSWGGCANWVCYCEQRVKEAAMSIVKDYLRSQMKLMAATASDRQIDDFSTQIVEATYQKRLTA
jgi:hypothetical protein